MKKVVIVTGASSGIGKASTLQLIKEGHTVYGAARRVEKMKELVSAGGKAVAIDITKHDQVHTEIQKIIETEFSEAMDQKLTQDGSSPYKELEQIIVKMIKNTNKPGQYSEPTVIANTISKAINSKNPKSRYAAGKMAKQTLLARKMLSDKGFDKMFLRMVKNYGKQ